MPVQLLLVLSAVYLVAGLLFAIAFLTKGITIVDETTQGSSTGFRIIILPGVILLWPLLLKKWVKAKPESHDEKARKRHLQIWIALALLLPSGIVVAWLSVPSQPTQVLLQPGMLMLLPIVLKHSDKQTYSVAIRSNREGSQLQLEWINKTVLQYPTATIYAGTVINDFAKAKLIGRIEARGNWYFPLDSTFKITPGSTDHFTLYDFIHNQVIDTINIKP